MSADGSDLSYLANTADDAAGGSSLYQKAKSSIADGVVTAGTIGVGATAAATAFPGAAIAIGSALGSTVPVIGTAIGAVIGTIIALFEFFKKNPNPGIDDAYWDTLGDEGVKTHEPDGHDISTAQIALVTRFAQGVASQPNWQAHWPIFWWNIAHSDNPHSSLLADAVARFLGAPQSTVLPNGTHLVGTDGKTIALPNGSRGAPPFPPASIPKPAPPRGNVTLLPILKAPSSLNITPINPKTGLPFPRTGAAPGAPTTAQDPAGLAGMNLSAIATGLGGAIMGFGGWDPTKPITLSPAQQAAVAAGRPMPAPDGSAPKSPTPYTGPVITIAQLQSGSSIPLPAHITVAAAAAGNAAAQTAILDAASAARSPVATLAQKQLADTLALAHKIQTHAKYVQKWLGPAAGEAVLAAHYLTVANLGSA